MSCSRHDTIAGGHQGPSGRLKAVEAGGADPDAVVTMVADGRVLPTVRVEHDDNVDTHCVWGVPTVIASARAVFIRLLDRPSDPSASHQKIERLVELVTASPSSTSSSRPTCRSDTGRRHHPTDSTRSDLVKVQLLYFNGCANWSTTDAHLRSLADERDLVVERRRIATPEEAETAGFRGSPTILIEANDPFATGDEPTGLACRIYRDRTGQQAHPRSPSCGPCSPEGSDDPTGGPPQPTGTGES